MTKSLFRLITIYEIIYITGYGILNVMQVISPYAALGFIFASVLSIVLISVNLVKNRNAEIEFIVMQYLITIAIMISALCKAGI